MSGDRVRLVIDGREHLVARGTTVAAALLGESITAFRRSVSGAPRAPLCGMGVCYECRVTIDGVAHERACLVEARDGMRIDTARPPEVRR